MQTWQPTCSRSAALDHFDREIPEHDFHPLTSASDIDAYDELVDKAYRPLQFLDGKAATGFLPSGQTRRYGLYAAGCLRGICALNLVANTDSHFHRHLPRHLIDGRLMVEMNNVILAKNRDPGPWLALLLYRSVREAIRLGFDLVVGITRFHTLKYFIDSGATPVYHPPLHLLGRQDLSDFIVYYDAADAESVDYLLRHIPRTIDAGATYARIKTDFIKRGAASNE